MLREVPEAGFAAPDFFELEPPDEVLSVESDVFEPDLLELDWPDLSALEDCLESPALCRSDWLLDWREELLDDWWELWLELWLDLWLEVWLEVWLDLWLSLSLDESLLRWL